jgi:integrase
MAIKLNTYKIERPGTRYDAELGGWIGYVVDVHIGKRRPRYGPFATKKKAEDFLDDFKHAARYKRAGLKYSPRKANEIRFKDLIEKRLADIPDRKRKELVKRVLNYLLDIAGEYVRVTEISYENLKEFNKRRAAELTVGRDTPVTEATIDREMTEISSTLKNAGEYFPELEGWQTPKIPRLRLPDIRRERRISPIEQLALIDHFARPREPNECDGQYFDRILIGHSFEFALLTSSRRKEVVRLKRTDYRPKQDELRIVRWKTIKAKKQSISIFSPVPRRVQEILELRGRLDPNSDYFFSKDGSDSYGYLKAMKLACEKLDILYGRYTDGGLIFHDTRHTFVSEMLEEPDADLETVRDLAGLSRDMILRYAHASPQSRRRASAAIDRRSRNGHSDLTKELTNVFENVRSGKIGADEFIAKIIDLWSQNGQQTRSKAA